MHTPTPWMTGHAAPESPPVAAAQAPLVEVAAGDHEEALLRNYVMGLGYQ